MNAPTTFADLLPPVLRRTVCEMAQDAATACRTQCMQRALAVRAAILDIPRHASEPELIQVLQGVAQWIRSDPGLRSYTGIADGLDRDVIKVDGALQDDRGADVPFGAEAWR